MPLTLKQISETIGFMDETYDANFEEWIKNEDNCKIVGCNLKKYIESYRESEFITVVKWIVKDWTLKSIIIFSKKMIIEDLHVSNPEMYARKVKILSGLIYTWSPIFTSEFLIACTAELTTTQRIDFMVSSLSVFDSKKLAEILSQLENKLDTQSKNDLVKKFKDSIYNTNNNPWKRTGSMMESYNIM
jgi:hypothetical protein